MKVLALVVFVLVFAAANVFARNPRLKCNPSMERIYKFHNKVDAFDANSKELLKGNAPAAIDLRAKVTLRCLDTKEKGKYKLLLWRMDLSNVTLRQRGALDGWNKFDAATPQQNETNVFEQTKKYLKIKLDHEFVNTTYFTMSENGKAYSMYKNVYESQLVSQIKASVLGTIQFKLNKTNKKRIEQDELGTHSSNYQRKKLATGALHVSKTLTEKDIIQPLDKKFNQKEMRLNQTSVVVVSPKGTVKEAVKEQIVYFGKRSKSDVEGASFVNKNIPMENYVPNKDLENDLLSGSSRISLRYVKSNAVTAATKPDTVSFQKEELLSTNEFRTRYGLAMGKQHYKVYTLSDIARDTHKWNMKNHIASIKKSLHWGETEKMLMNAPGKLNPSIMLRLNTLVKHDKETVAKLEKTLELILEGLRNKVTSEEKAASVIHTIQNLVAASKLRSANNLLLKTMQVKEMPQLVQSGAVRAIAHKRRFPRLVEYLHSVFKKAPEDMLLPFTAVAGTVKKHKLSQLVSEDVKKQLKELVTNASKNSTEAAIHLLLHAARNLKSVDVDTLRQIVRGDFSVPTKLAAIDSTSTVRSPDVRAFVRELVKHDEKNVRASGFKRVVKTIKSGKADKEDVDAVKQVILSNKYLKQRLIKFAKKFNKVNADNEIWPFSNADEERKAKEVEGYASQFTQATLSAQTCIPSGSSTSKICISDADMISFVQNEPMTGLSYNKHAAFEKRFGTSHINLYAGVVGYAGMEPLCSKSLGDYSFNIFGRAATKGQIFGKNINLFEAKVERYQTSSGMKQDLLYVVLFGKVFKNEPIFTRTSVCGEKTYKIVPSQEYSIIPSTLASIQIMLGTVPTVFSVKGLGVLAVDAVIKYCTDALDTSAAVVPTASVSVAASGSIGFTGVASAGLEIQSTFGVSVTPSIQASAKLCNVCSGMVYSTNPVTFALSGKINFFVWSWSKDLLNWQSPSVSSQTVVAPACIGKK